MWRALKNEDGAAIVEFAIIVPVLLAIAWGIVLLGQMFYSVNSLASAVREGARYGAVQTSPATNPATAAAIKARVALTFVPFGSPPLDTATQVTVNLAGDRITVQAAYPMQEIAWPDSVIITQTAVYRWEQAP